MAIALYLPESIWWRREETGDYVGRSLRECAARAVGETVCDAKSGLIMIVVCCDECGCLGWVDIAHFGGECDFACSLCWVTRMLDAR